MYTATICTFDLIPEKKIVQRFRLKKTTIDVSGLFFWQVNWEILVSKFGKINSFLHWEWYRLSVPVTYGK